jgi:hypothetical protein
MHAFPLFQQLRKQHYSVRDIGFQVGTATVNRVQARYRLARSCQGINLEGYNPNTAKAYSELFRLFLAYSAFEQFLTLYRIPFYEIEGRFAGHAYANTSEAIRQADPNGRLLDFLHAELDSAPHKTRIREFQAGGNNNPVVVAAALRHLFAHGKLGPNANKSYPVAVGRISERLCGFLLDFMDMEFAQSLRAFCTARGIPADIP